MTQVGQRPVQVHRPSRRQHVGIDLIQKPDRHSRVGRQGLDAGEQGGPVTGPSGWATRANCQGMGQKARRAGCRNWAAKNGPATWGTGTKRDGSESGEASASSNASHEHRGVS